jgi:hypothetical protein
LYKHLHSQKRRRKRCGRQGHRENLPNRRGIEERPEIVDQHQRIGDQPLVGKSLANRFSLRYLRDKPDFPEVVTAIASPLEKSHQGCFMNSASLMAS